ncbi:MAG: Fic family protein, partial [Actinomycetota bacterium]|nr:Fic family protein [Actinomycetota bacterium]
LAKGALATTAIEGNTLSEEQAVEAVRGTLRLPPSQEYLAQEIKNVIKGFNSIKDDLGTGGSPSLTVEEIKQFNRWVLEDLPLDEGVVPGEISTHSVVVGGYRGAPREDCEHLLQELCHWLNDGVVASSEEMHIPYAIIRAVLAHLYLAWIHPFGDGNGRTARLIELKILCAAGLPLPASHLLSNHYNQTRSEYYRQLEHSSQVPGGDAASFLAYAVLGFVDGLRTQLELVREQQWDDRWEQYVYETFGGNTQSPSKQRQLRLVLDLSRAGGAVRRAKLTTLSPEVAAAYAQKTRKTLTRDLNALSAMGLIEWTADGYRARREVILAFLPATPVQRAAEMVA